MKTRSLLAAFPLLLCLPLPTVVAQPFLYGLNEKGQLVFNATVLDRLKTSFDVDSEGMEEQPQEKWFDLAVVGSDRYALRLDGVVSRNGRTLHRLPFLPTRSSVWTRLVVEASRVYVLRTDGAIAVDGLAVAALPPLEGVLLYQDFVVIAGDVRALRTDGAIFLPGSATPTFQFVGGPGLDGSPDGQQIDTLWGALSVDPIDGAVYALRRDGKIFRGILPGGAVEGEAVASLPFPADIAQFEIADFYIDIEFTEDGAWKVLRGNGQVYSEGGLGVPVVDLPGNTSENDKLYRDLATLGSDFWALRFDGRVYRNVDPLLDLPGGRYRRIAVSSDPPDLSKIKNQKPAAAVYRTTAIRGVPVSIPVVVTDADRVPDDIGITPLDPLPPGALWNAPERRLDWEAPGPPGSHRFTVEVDNGEQKPLRFRYRVKVIEPDMDPEKNRPPVVAKIKKAQALVGFEISLPIIAVDPDGDPLTFSVETDRHPFTAGAVFDTETRTIRWTPAFEDIGKAAVRIVVDDGTKRKKLNVKILVKDPLIF